MAQPAPNCDQLQAQIAEIEKQPSAATVARQPLNTAASTVVRARDARAAGDVEHGMELEALAADYVTIARTALRAAALEAQLRAVQTKQTELETALRQTETLLEATVAQRERTKAALQQWLANQQANKIAADTSMAGKTAGKSAGSKASVDKTAAGKAAVLKTEPSKTKQGASK